MRLHYGGKYNGDPKTLANQRQVPGAVKFHEPELTWFAIISNILSVALLIGCYYLGILRGSKPFFNSYGFVAAIISLIPHELIHAMCFKEDVYFYMYLSKALLFVVGEEDMTRKEYVLMSLMPNIVFGLIPYIIFMVDPSLTFLGTLGAFAIGFGMGDYINIFHALTQMPSNAVTYLCQNNSYWYIPDGK